MPRVFSDGNGTRRAGTRVLWNLQHRLISRCRTPAGAAGRTTGMQTTYHPARGPPWLSPHLPCPASFPNLYTILSYVEVMFLLLWTFGPFCCHFYLRHSSALPAWRLQLLYAYHSISTWAPACPLQPRAIASRACSFSHLPTAHLPFLFGLHSNYLLFSHIQNRPWVHGKRLSGQQMWADSSGIQGGRAVAKLSLSTGAFFHFP